MTTSNSQQGSNTSSSSSSSPPPTPNPTSIILSKLNNASIYANKKPIQKELMARILSRRDLLIDTYFYEVPESSGGALQQRDDDANAFTTNQQQHDDVNSLDTASVHSADSQLSDISTGTASSLMTHQKPLLLFNYWNLDELSESSITSSLHHHQVGHSNDSTSASQWKIKFLLSTTTPDPGIITKFTNKMVSKTGSWLDMLPEFGLFHTALIVGPHKIEWIDTSLCVPRPVQTTNAVLLMDIDYIRDAAHYKRIREKLSERIEWWNLNMKYAHRTSSSKDWRETKLGNCQQFVNDIIGHLDLEPQFRKKLKCLKPVLDRIISNGDALMELNVSRPFFDLFPIGQDDINRMNETGQVPLFDHFARHRHQHRDEAQSGDDKKSPHSESTKEYTPNMVLRFESHRQLDLYVSSILMIDPDALQRAHDEIQILKAFDRAFWLQKRKHEFIKKSNPDHEIPEDCFEYQDGCCPFVQPDLTHSIMEMPQASFTKVIENFKEERKANKKERTDGGGSE